MTLTQILLTSIKRMLPGLFLGPLHLTPFIIAEELRPVGDAPRPIWSAQFCPVLAAADTLLPKRRSRSGELT